jgi:hypothetical protein
MLRPGVGYCDDLKESYGCKGEMVSASCNNVGVYDWNGQTNWCATSGAETRRPLQDAAESDLLVTPPQPANKKPTGCVSPAGFCSYVGEVLFTQPFQTIPKLGF